MQSFWAAAALYSEGSKMVVTRIKSLSAGCGSRGGEAGGGEVLGCLVRGLDC